MQIVERIAEHYEVQHVELGRVYKWCPECVVIECECGKRTTHTRAALIGSEVTACECGSGRDGMARIREELVFELLDENYEASHYPWRYWHSSAADTGIPF